MDNAIAFREQFNSLPDTKISFNDMIVKACALALRQHPQVNSQWFDDRMRLNNHVHIGVAVAVEDKRQISPTGKGIGRIRLKLIPDASADSLNAFVNADPQLAKSVCARDDEIDDLNYQLGEFMFFCIFYDRIKRLYPQKVKDYRIDVTIGRGLEKISTDEELLKAWEQQKSDERESKSSKPEVQSVSSALDGIASTLPALKWSEKIQKRAAHTGFDWDELAPVFEKLNEEIVELKQEVDIENNHERIMDEMGDVLFSCVNLSRHLGVSAEQALRQGNRKFIGRFQQMEQFIAGEGRAIDECSLVELEEYWQKAKSGLKNIANE